MAEIQRGGLIRKQFARLIHGRADLVEESSAQEEAQLIPQVRLRHLLNAALRHQILERYGALHLHENRIEIAVPNAPELRYGHVHGVADKLVERRGVKSFQGVA